MKKTADIVIIGAGIIGVSIAYYLGKMGAKNVVVLEKDHICEGSTALCAGGIRRQYTSDIAMQFAQKSFEVFQNFKEEFDVDPQFHPVGYLFLATSLEEWDIFQQNVAFQNKYNVPSQILTQEEIGKRWPYLNTEDVYGGAFCDTDGYASPHEITHAIAKKARTLGIDIFEETEVKNIEVRHDRVVSVTAGEYRVETPIVVNAAGPYAENVGRLAGIHIPVKPIRRQLFITDPFDQLPESVPLTIDHKQNFYFRREGKTVLLSGPQDEIPSFNLNTDFDSMVETAEKAMYRVPVFENTNIARGWGGLYEISPDNNAILGKVPEIGGLILANGFSGHGFQHGPATGMVIAEVIVNGRTETIDIEKLSYERFRKGELIKESLTAFHD
jgi:sarcosine oxidase subunit beta